MASAPAPSVANRQAWSRHYLLQNAAENRSIIKTQKAGSISLDGELDGFFQVVGWAGGICTGWVTSAFLPQQDCRFSMHGYFGVQWLQMETGCREGQLKYFTKDFRAVLASSQDRLKWEHFEILLDKENSTGSPPPKKVWDG